MVICANPATPVIVYCQLFDYRIDFHRTSWSAADIEPVYEYTSQLLFTRLPTFPQTPVDG